MKDVLHLHAYYEHKYIMHLNLQTGFFIPNGAISATHYYPSQVINQVRPVRKTGM